MTAFSAPPRAVPRADGSDLLLPVAAAGRTNGGARSMWEMLAVSMYSAWRWSYCYSWHPPLEEMQMQIE